MVKTQHPYKYVKFRGCFGSSPHYVRESQRTAVIKGGICVYDDEDFGLLVECMNKVLENPEIGIDMKDVTSITIRGALILKAFFDEFFLLNNRKPRLRGPRDKKMRAVLTYLCIRRYKDVERLHYPDIECWQIKTFDHSETDIDFPKMLHKEIIPKCWPKDHMISEYSANIASSVAEALLNSKEHAYTGDKEAFHLKKWYLGVGEYPRTGKFAFCIYDKGIGIRSRLKAKPEGWFKDIADMNRSDSEMIKLATKGRSGSTESTEGRGQGLKSAIDLLDINSGNIDIYSDRGFFSSDNRESGKDRRSRLEGTLVTFSFPLEYKKEAVKL